MKVAAFLPVKGTSSRVANKNISLLDGKPLFLHTLEKLIDCGFIDEVYLDTDSDEIICIADYLDCKVLKRDAELASNKTDGNRLFMNEVRQVNADIYIQALCTSPFVSPATIKAGIEVLSGTEYDSAVLISREKQYTWSDSGPKYDLNNIPNSVDLPDTLIETMGLYIVKREAALETKRRIGNRPYILPASPLEAIDVNWPEDFKLANLIAAGLREKDRMLLENIKNQLNSSMLSDILDDLGVSHVINGLKPNFDSAKIFGRAKTLKIRALAEGEDFRGIYDALHSYKTIVPNDVIVVENEINNFAYFGEMNANLAIRSGAAGAIVGGMTRDSADVTKLGFPVFAEGTKCKDVRGRATLESINKPVMVNGVQVSPGDLIFADSEGVVVIPKAFEAKVLELAFNVMRKEKSVLLDIANGTDVELLVQRNGEF
jgi:regulator of RNase E activity RraA/CMP-N-acetylneuraminic acid synthetase